MANNTFVSEKRKALLARKEKLLEELKYYEKRVQDEQSKTTVEYYFDDDSSESDDDLGITTDLGPSIMQLKLEQSKLRTCLQATQELTNLQILQSEVSVILNDPVLTRESPVKEPGTWREVTAECRIDLIPFSITFYVHKSNARFGATLYRGLQVMLVKAAHEAELSKSVLPTLVRPSDALEVLRSYADAYRSRRSTLARLATKYADSLYMEPMAEGGYMLKCANLLQVAWRLENKWSPLAPFHHRMKFDLEYMEEKYINTITQSHKQLSDPTISTDERTLLLSKIIATCLEAKPESESAESDQDARMPKRRATLDQEIEEPESKKKKEVMAPPKSLPKKSKTSKIMSDKSRPSDNNNKNTPNENNRDVDKENVDNNLTKANVAANSNAGIEKSVGSSSKGQKSGDKAPKKVTSSKNVVESSKSKETESIDADVDAKNKPKKTKSTPKTKNPETQTDNVEKLQSGKKIKDKNSKKVVSSNENNANVGVSKDPNKAKKSKVNDEQVVTTNKKKNKEVAVDKNEINVINNDNKASKNNKVNPGAGSKTKTVNVDTGKKNNVETEVSATHKKPSEETTDVNNLPKKTQTSETKEKTVTKTANKVQSSDTTNKVIEKNVASNKNKDNIADITKKTSSVKTVSNSKNNKNENNKNKDAVNKKTAEANIQSNKAKAFTGDMKVTDKKGIKNDKNKDSAINSDAVNVLKNADKERNEKSNNPKSKMSQVNINNGSNVKNIDHAKKSVLPLRMENNMKTIRKSIGSIRTKPSNIAKENVGLKSKIPQKKLSPLNEKILKKNPLRMSPRHMASTFKNNSSLGSKYSAQKPTTNIPRLAKPMFKAK